MEVGEEGDYILLATLPQHGCSHGPIYYTPSGKL